VDARHPDHEQTSTPEYDECLHVDVGHADEDAGCERVADDLDRLADPGALRRGGHQQQCLEGGDEVDAGWCDQNGHQQDPQDGRESRLPAHDGVSAAEQRDSATLRDEDDCRGEGHAGRLVTRCHPRPEELSGTNEYLDPRPQETGRSPLAAARRVLDPLCHSPG